LIRSAIERRIASRLWGARAEVEASLPGDVQLQEAIRILREPGLYAEKMGISRAVTGKRVSTEKVRNAKGGARTGK
jgi:hypothetical protein